MFYNYHQLGIEVHGHTSGRVKTYCPKCRESRHNKADKSLSVNLDDGVFKCHYCGWSGKVEDESKGKTGQASLSAQPSKPIQPSKLKTSKTAQPGRLLQYALPPRESGELSTEQMQWLTRTRGLSPESIAILGITSALHYFAQTAQKEPCLCFNYYEGGELVNIKYRTTHAKHFALTAGAELIPYHIDGIRDTPEAIIVEGELDAAAFVTAGRTDVVSVPGGANRNLTWMDRFMETHFEQKQTVYIAVDTDTKGTELRDELLRRLGAERCRIVTYGEDCKDANELLVKAGAAALLQALADAPEIPLEGVYGAADVAAEMRALFENGLSRGADTGLDDFDDLCTFETGRFCVVTGHPGDGKSEFTDELVLRLCLRHGWRAAYFSPENLPLPYHLCKLTEKLTGCKFKKGLLSEMLYEASQRYLQENVASILPSDDFSVERVLTLAHQLVARKGIRVLVIDPFNKLEHLIPSGQTETQYISSFLDQLANFAQRHRCLVILVAHPRKMQRNPATGLFPVPTLQDINGSAAFVNKCDFGLVVERDREVGVTRIHVKKVKFRHLGRVGECSFVYNTVNGRYSPCREDPSVEQPDKRVIETKFDCKPWIGREEAVQGELPSFLR